MCCPGLKHLNLSSCRSITDAAFNFLESKRNTSSRASANSASSTCTSKPGQNLTSVDVSGCQLLSTLAVKHLVGLCGANLTSVNLAWTGVNCTALLYLAGLHMDQVARLVQETNPSSDNSLQVSEDANQADHTSSKCFTMHRAQPDNKRGLEKQSCADFSKENGQDLQNEPSCSQILQNLTQDNSTVSKPCAISANPFGETERLAVDLHDCDENQLSEMELSRLKDVLPVTCKSSMLMSPDAEHLEDLKSSSDDDSDDSFKTAPDEVTPMLCFPSEEEATFLGSKEENLRHEESSEMQEISSSAVHGHSGVMSAAVGRKVCWNVPVENESSFKNLQTKETSSVEVCGAGVGTLLTCVQGVTSKELDPKAVFGSEHRGEINTIMTIPPEQSKGELTTEETYEDCFDMESHPVISCEGGSNVQSGQFVAKSELKTSSFRRDCDDAIMTVNGKERQNPTMLCKGVKDKELKWVKSEYPNMPCAIVDHRESEFSIELCGRVDHRNTECPLSSAPVKCGESENSLIPCEAGDLKESDFPSLPCEVVMDRELQCENSCMHCEAETGEHTHPVALDFLKETGNKCSHSIIPCTVHENQKPSTWSVLPQTQSEVATKPCWGETSVGPCEEETDSTEEIWDPDCSSSCVRVVQIADLLQRQLYRPQITSLDITNIFYQSKVLGEACLKIFFKACKCLKNFAVSWTELDDGVLTYLLKNAPDLEALSLVGVISQMNERNVILMHETFVARRIAFLTKGFVLIF